MEGKRRRGDVCVCECVLERERERGGGVGCRPKRNLCAEEEEEGKAVDGGHGRDSGGPGTWEQEKLAFQGNKSLFGKTGNQRSWSTYMCVCVCVCVQKKVVVVGVGQRACLM